MPFQSKRQDDEWDSARDEVWMSWGEDLRVHTLATGSGALGVVKREEQCGSETE